MKDKRNNLLIQYAGFGAQLAVSILLTVYAGGWIDKKINTKFPLFLWALPIVVIIGMIIKLIRDTSNK
ncbi:MAG TPA: AtpZ/AtpI family protein [Chitinophagaceae bacterium]|nr:AtpZ/AtpI family protein [Chitinophagaceae bacterium]